MRNKDGRKSYNTGLPCELYEDIKKISVMDRDKSFNQTIVKALEEYRKKKGTEIKKYNDTFEV